MVASVLLGVFFPTPLLHTGFMETQLTPASSSQLATAESLIVSFLRLCAQSRKETEQCSSLVGQSYMLGEDKVSAMETTGLRPLATIVTFIYFPRS